MEKRKIIISISLILVITFITFLPSLNNGFTNWDDGLLIFHNQTIKDLSVKAVGEIIKLSLSGNYYPVSLLSNAVEYYFFKLNPFIYHFNNLILHLLNCLFVFWFVLLITNHSRLTIYDSRLTTRDLQLTTDNYPLSPNPYPLMVAFITAILFGIHPLHTEPVAWLAERRAMIYTFFFLASVICYLYYSRTAKSSYYWLSFIFFILSALSKSMVVMLPCILILLDYFLGQKLDKKSLVEKSPFLGLAIIGIFVRFRELNFGDLTIFSQNLFFAASRLVFYLIKTVIPINLSGLYHTAATFQNIVLYPPLTEISKLLPFDYRFSSVIVIVLIGLIIITKKHTQKIIFGSLFFLILILPALQVLPDPRILIADRYTYIPSIGLFYLVGEGFAYLYYKKLKDLKIIKIILVTILTSILLILSILTWQRCKVWKDSMTLWNDVLKNYPRVLEAYNNRGNIYLSQNNYDRAIADYNQAVAIAPYYVQSYNNRGNAYYRKDEYNKALDDYNQVLRLKPQHAATYNNRGNVYLKKEEYAKAIADYNQALAINPNILEAYNNRGNAYRRKEEYAKAIADYNYALSINPDMAAIYNNRALTYFLQKEYTKAWQDIKKMQSLGYQPDAEFLELLKNRLGDKN